MKMQDSAFDILSGTPLTKVKWLESVTGLANARKRMNELAAQAPGPYFIFNTWNSCIIEQIDTPTVDSTTERTSQTRSS